MQTDYQEANEAIKKLRYEECETNHFSSGVPRCTFTFDWNRTKHHMEEDTRKKISPILKALRNMGFDRSSAKKHAFGTEYTTHFISPDSLEQVKVLALRLNEIIQEHKKQMLGWCDYDKQLTFKVGYIDFVEIDGLFISKE